MPSGPSCARSMESRSTGGTAPPRRRSPGLVFTTTATSTARSASGARAASHKRGADHWISGVTAHLYGFEQAHPAQLGELALVRMEHELSRISESCLDDGALALAEHDR